MPKIIYYRHKCIGCNGCVEAAPEQWRMSRKDGKSNLLSGQENKGIYTRDIHDFELEANLKAAQSCPAKVIKVQY